MSSTLYNLILENAIPVSTGIIFALIFKAFFSKDRQREIREYQIDIVKSRSKILQLQARNEELEKLLNEREPSFIKDRLFLN
jgi:hypothetical protein